MPDIAAASVGTADAAPAAAEDDQITLRQKTANGRSEKDKSTKRKSNLNRALTDEQVVSPANTQNESQGSCHTLFLSVSNWR